MGIDTRAPDKEDQKFGNNAWSADNKTADGGTAGGNQEIPNCLPVDRVTTKEIYKLGEGSRRVAVMDFGLKRNIIRSLVARGVETTVFPARIGQRKLSAAVSTA